VGREGLGREGSLYQHQAIFFFIYRAVLTSALSPLKKKSVYLNDLVCLERASGVSRGRFEGKNAPSLADCCLLEPQPQNLDDTPSDEALLMAFGDCQQEKKIVLFDSLWAAACGSCLVP